MQWARANDEDAALERLRREAGGEPRRSRKPTIETFEWSPTVELLAQMFELDQQQIHATHTHQTKAAKRKPKITRYPTPRTAMSRVKKAAARKAFQQVESMLVFSDEPYGPESPLVRHSKHPASAGWAQVQNKPQQQQQRQRARPNELRPRPQQ